MNRDDSATRSIHGSYVQLSTFDEKEKGFVSSNHAKSSHPRPYTRCLCSKRDGILVAVVLIGAFIIVTVSLSLGLPKIKDKRQHYLNPSFPVSDSPLLTFSSAVVIADGKPCAAIGKNILAINGSAMDAALATLICNGVVNPHSMGLGGGFLMTIYTRGTKTAAVIDAREVAPQNATKDMFAGNATLSREGGLSIAVPGELRGYKLAHETYGKLPWKDLVTPSITICNEGFEVSEHIASHLQSLKDRILADESMKSEFFNNATNDVFKAGEILKRPVLAKTLTKLADEGPDALYTGSLKKEFLEDIAKCGGIVNEFDLSNYKPLLKDSVKSELVSPKPLTLHSVPPPGSGLVLSFILSILANYNMTAEDFKDTNMASLMYHRIAEAYKFGFAHRTRLGDEDFVNITEVIDNMQSSEYARSFWKLISDQQTYPVTFYRPMTETVNDHGTAHVSVLAANGDAVSVTSSINTYFGSMCRSPSTGIILNNGMDDFSSANITNYFDLPPFPTNFIAPGKRPLSSMCPLIATDQNGDVKLVIGGAGGTRIITASAMGVIRTHWLSEDIKQTTDAPRIHHQLFPNYIQYEPAFPKIYLDNLRKYGHVVEPETQASVFLGIVREDDQLKTNVDFRKGGSAAGF